MLLNSQGFTDNYTRTITMILLYLKIKRRPLIKGVPLCWELSRLLVTITRREAYISRSLALLRGGIVGMRRY